jgi:DNA primase
MNPMRYGPNLLDEILRRTDIVQLVGRRVKLTRRGQAFWGCCPFHAEKSASFKVENSRRTYKCFGCGKGGDAFKWLMETEGLNFPEAVEKLAGEAGGELPKWTPEDEAREEKKKSLYDVIEAAAVFYEAQLYDQGGRTARDYLKSRGFDEAASRRFRLGFAPASGTALIDHLTAKNITQDDMIAAGLARPADAERGVRDFFFNRLIFPITDSRGRTVAFGGRGLTADAKPKYINSGETEFFSKGRQLYNFATARPAGIKAQTIIVAEGYRDVIALVRAGFEASVAPLGTALTEDQLHLLWRVAPEPVMAFDGDEAGRKAAIRAAHLALPALKPGYSLRFAFLPAGEDPDSLIRAAGAPAMQKLLDAAEPLGEVLWRAETEGHDFSTPERRAGLERTLSDLVSLIGDGKIADYYRRDFENRIFEAFKRRAQRAPRTSQASQASLASQASQASRSQWAPRNPQKGGAWRGAAQPEPVSAALKTSALVRTGTYVPPKAGSAEGVSPPLQNPGAQKVKEWEVCRLLLDEPELAANHTELLAAIHFSDPLLDRLRQELLNVAASGSRLEKQGLENHLVRQGMAELLERLKAPMARSESAPGEDADARFLQAANQLRDMAERDPERRRVLERFKREASEESWQDVRRLLGGQPGK